MKDIFSSWRIFIDNVSLLEEKKDRCYRTAKRKYKVFPSAYASGAIVKCRQGKIWKNVKEAAYPGNMGIIELNKFFDNAPEEEIKKFDELLNSGKETEAWDMVKKFTGVELKDIGTPGSSLQEKADFSKEKESSLHGWFSRQGGKGKSKGWVDCNTCREDKKTGRKTCKTCGRKEDEKRSKYPACRPTPSQCTNKGKKEKKSSKRVSWKEDMLKEETDFSGERDDEGQMALSQLLKTKEYAEELLHMITPDMQLPSWIQSKITLIDNYIGTVKHYLEGEMKLKHLEEESEVTFETEGVCEGEACMLEFQYQDCGCGLLAESMLLEAEYQGRKVALNKPMKGDVKKFKVYVKDPKTGNVKKVNFGDKKMRIKKSNPKRRKSFRARHRCESPGPKTKARYWSCKKW